ncbi:phage tail protein [Rhodopseudomonas pseudopalustris]|uniref:Microcystin-dependent protein n=1 Tax=Rhodopseudomonas pseudopalustris TaxID=1513892 RepID=A0A1H8NBX2_9BRAD|nr:phage tail protein [Rhodopseudomonas pseudopalustris]SEO27104.1 Microcystin-dependent protein [Rhodopseudomonas pseudopalustris]
MPVETFSYLDSLETANPGVNDGIVNGDDHIRGIKFTLKNTFPGASTALTRAMGGTVGWLAADGSAKGPSYSFNSEGTLGFYRIKAGLIGVAGGSLRGTVPPGAIMDFALPAAPDGWLACDGQLVSTADHPDLFAAIGYLWGGSGWQFRVPPLINRYRRHRDSASVSGEVGNLQSSQLGSHAHTAHAEAQGGHAHSFSGTTGGMNANNPHSHGMSALSGTGNSMLAGFGYDNQLGTRTETNAADINHGHAFSGTTEAQGNHSHNITVLETGGNETRPESATVLTCIKA